MKSFNMGVKITEIIFIHLKADERSRVGNVLSTHDLI